MCQVVPSPRLVESTEASVCLKDALLLLSDRVLAAPLKSCHQTASDDVSGPTTVLRINTSTADAAAKRRH